MAKVKGSIYEDDAKGQDKFAAMLLALAEKNAAKIEEAKRKVEEAKRK